MTDKEETLNTANARTWTFKIEEHNGFRLDAPRQAKSAVADACDIDLRDLRAKLVNAGQFGDTFVVVVEVFNQ